MRYILLMAGAVPAAVRIRILFGGKATRFGLLWIALPLWIAVVMRFYTEPQPTFDNRADATIDRVEEVKAKDTTRYRVHYEFTDENGSKLADYSIADQRLPLGSAEVEYVTQYPSQSRIVGTLAHPTEDKALGFAVIIALAGLLGIGLELPDALRKQRFVRRSHGTVARVTSTSFDHKKKPPATTLVFEYDTPDGVREGTITRSDVPGLATYPILPIRFVLDQSDRVLSKFDFEPGVMTSEGELTGRDWIAWLLLVWPIAAALGAVAWIATSFI